MDTLLRAAARQLAAELATAEQARAEHGWMEVVELRVCLLQSWRLVLSGFITHVQ